MDAAKLIALAEQIFAQYENFNLGQAITIAVPTEKKSLVVAGHNVTVTESGLTITIQKA